MRAEEEPVLAELHWLIDEGYVIELSDGRLWATPEKSPPPAEPAEPPQPAAAAENNAAEAEQQETATPSPVPAQEP